MNLVSIALAFAWHNRVATVCTTVAVALATALLLLVLHVRRDIESDLRRHANRVDVIVGQPGSETALVLGSVLYAGAPRGTLSHRAFLEVLREPGVTSAYPLCLGDQVDGFPVVGTTAGFLQRTRSDGNLIFTLQDGRLFQNSFEMVAGSAAASALGLKIGQSLVTRHGSARGIEHTSHPYKVVGILNPTGTAQDRALFVTADSYWIAHADVTDGNEPLPTTGEISAVLVETEPAAVFQVQRRIADKFGLMAVRPAEVLQQLSDQILSPLERLLFGYGIAIAIAAAGTILATLYLTTMVRRRDHAILRSLGALPREIFTIVLTEAVIQLIFGCGLGILISRLALGLMRAELRREYGLDTTLLLFHPMEAVAILAVFAIGFVAALFPAFRAYRSDVAMSLRRA